MTKRDLKFHEDRTYEIGAPKNETQAEMGNPEYIRGYCLNYPGKYFLGKGCKSIQDFFEKNPQNWSDKKTFYVYQIGEDGTRKFLYKSNPYPPATGLNDATSEPVDGRYSSGKLSDSEYLMNQNRQLAQEAERLRRRNEELQQQVQDAEVARAGAEMEARIERERADNERQAIEKRHAEAIKAIKLQHETDLRICVLEAKETARDEIAKIRESGMSGIDLNGPAGQLIYEVGIKLANMVENKFGGKNPEPKKDGQYDEFPGSQPPDANPQQSIQPANGMPEKFHNVN